MWRGASVGMAELAALNIKNRKTMLMASSSIVVYMAQPSSRYHRRTSRRDAQGQNEA